MKRLVVWLLGSWLAAPVGSAIGGAKQINCLDVFKTPAFQSLDLPARYNARELGQFLSVLKGTRCTLDQLEQFLSSKSAVLGHKDTKNLQMTVRSRDRWTIPLIIPAYMSIGARVENDTVTHIDAAVHK